MGQLPSASVSRRPGAVLAAGALAVLVLAAPAATGREPAKNGLHVGSSGSLSPSKDEAKEKAALESLRAFIKEETGMDNQIVRCKGWHDLGERMSTGKLQVGVFQGYEFAWAQEQFPGLKPMALAVNAHRYPVAYVVTKKDNPARDFAGLQGQSLVVPGVGQPYLTLFVERQAQAAGKKPDAFFAKVTNQDNVEDALDDVVDGAVQVAVVDQAALEAYRKRKPGRFGQLKEVTKSQPFPPVVIAYHDKGLDEATLKRFRDGLLNASRKERGQMMLTLFRLTGFDAIPDDFGKVLADTRKAYPPEGGAE